MVAPAIISAGIAAGGSLLGGGISGRAAANERRHAEQRMLDMDNTKHQREVRDLRKAGLNPILSTTQGAASAGQVPGPAPVPDYSQVAEKGVQAYNAAKLLTEQVKLVEAQKENTDSQTRNNNLKYWMDKYFAPLERMQGINTGLQSYNLAKNQIPIQLNQLQADLEARKISNEDAKLLLDMKLKDPDFRRYFYSSEYGERVDIDKIGSKDMDPSDLIKLLLRMINK